MEASRGGTVVLVAEDDPHALSGYIEFLATAGFIASGRGDGREALSTALETVPDIVVTDIAMPRLNGIEVVRRLHEAVPQVRVLVLTMHQEDEYVLQAVRAGAAGYLVKDSAAEALLAAVRSLHAGRGYFGPQASRALAEQMQHPERQVDDPYGRLTPREREVFHLIVEGNTTKEIARKLDISGKTAENHRARVLDKLGVRNTAELVRYALKRGLLD